MTPVGFVFLTLMFGVIIPSPTHGRIKMTLREAMSMSTSALEKRQLRPENDGELAALLTLMKCLDKLGQGTDTPCSEQYFHRVNTKLVNNKNTKLLNIDVEDIPLDAWVRVSMLKCLEPLICRGVCTCRNQNNNGRPDYGNPDPNPCPRIERDPSVKCDKEYRDYHKFIPPTIPTTPSVLHVQLHNHGVSVSISGWWITIMAATAYAISRH